MEDKIVLTTNDILEKQFKIDARGYRPQEVDKFLDIIMEDYIEYDNIIKRYDSELKAMMEENSRLKNELRGVTNVDILRRLGELEKIVYGETHN